MLIRKIKGISLITAIVLFVAFTSCDTTDPRSEIDGLGIIQMKHGSGASGVEIQSTLTQQGAIRVSDGTNEIEIKEVKFFIEEFDLEGRSGTADYALEDLDDFIVKLPLDGTPVIIIQGEIPTGFYDEFEMDIENPDSEIDISDLDFRDETGSYSIVIKGLYNGENFRFRTSEDFEIDVDLNPPLEISEISQSTLVIEIFVPIWFMGADGKIMNPNDQKNIDKIDENIEDSFEDRFDD